MTYMTQIEALAGLFDADDMIDNTYHNPEYLKGIVEGFLHTIKADDNPYEHLNMDGQRDAVTADLQRAIRRTDPIQQWIDTMEVGIQAGRIAYECEIGQTETEEGRIILAHGIMETIIALYGLPEGLDSLKSRAVLYAEISKPKA